MQDSCKTDDNLQESNKKLCKMFKNHATFLHAIWLYTILKEIMQDSCTIAMQEFNKKLCKMFKNHATLLHDFWYIHKILKEIMQDVQKSCNLLACYLIRTQDSQGKYARNVQKQYKKILCKKIINVQKPCNILHNFWQELTIHLHTLHTL